jgi:tetratricopeptide (TPR) repeat protein
VVTFAILILLITSFHQTVFSQTEPVTYPQIITALNSKVPNPVFQNKAQIISFLIKDIKKKKVSEPLNETYEKLLRDSGATDQLIQTIKENYFNSEDNILDDETVSEGLDGLYFLERGKAFRKKNDCKNAIIEYTKAIELLPGLAEAYNGRGYCYNSFSPKIRNLDKAVNDLNTAILLDPNSADAYFNRGTSYLLKNNYRQSILDLNKAIELNPDFAFAIFNRGVVHFYQNEIDKAIKDFTETIKYLPGESRIFLFRGKAYQKQNNTALAMEDFRQVLQLNPNSKEAKDLLAKLEENEDKELFMPSRELTLAQILTGLSSNASGFTLNQKNEFITESVRRRGVSFRLTKGIEKELKNSGANAALLAAIRRASPN